MTEHGHIRTWCKYRYQLWSGWRASILAVRERFPFTAILWLPFSFWMQHSRCSACSACLPGSPIHLPAPACGTISLVPLACQCFGLRGHICIFFFPSLLISIHQKMIYCGALSVAGLFVRMHGCVLHSVSFIAQQVDRVIKGCQWGIWPLQISQLLFL